MNLTDMTLRSTFGTSFNETTFDISPKDFLKFAKEDLKEGNEKGFINSITNSKRAIDCQIDQTIETLISKYENFNPIINDFLQYFEFESDIPIKLRIIHALNLAPSLIISKSRTLRNKLEHMYKKPEIDDVKEALDVADLFIRSVTGKLGMLWSEFEIVDWKDNELTFEYLEKQFKIGYKKDHKLIKTYSIDSNNLEFYGLLRLMISSEDEIEIEETFKILLKQINHPMPIDKIRLYQGD
ncbi:MULTISPECIES: hypothetical protein [Chryseobacterium]|nr:MULTISPECIES: hypothetical protein [Chryseobacterium]